jgi:Tol biopolymer transport system component
LYFSGENGCTIGWVSAQGGDSLPVGSIPAELCKEDADHWSIKRWSPDGSLFAMAMMDATQGRSPGAYSIQIMRFDGTPVYQLISGSGGIPPAGLSWSPDGKRLAYVVAEETESATIFVLRVLPVDGVAFTELAVIQLTDESISMDDMALPGQHFVWSPDGQSLALTAVDSSKQNGLYLARSIENAFSQFASSLPSNVTVSWSPDGSLIAYNDGLDWKAITEYGEGQTVVSGDSSKDVFCLAWTPDSAELICLVRVTGGAGQLMAFRADGSGEPRLLVGDAALVEVYASNAQWSPDGTLLALRDIEYPGLYIFDAVNATLGQLNIDTQGDFVWGRP